MGAFKTGVRMGLRLQWNKVRYCRINVPEPSVALELAAFLDRETARIDGLIEKKTRFIALLKEKRAAVITHAVTKGLDPDVPMKDSGVGWLGRVPAHWRVCRGAAFLFEKRERNFGTKSTSYLSLMASRGIIPYEEKGDVGNKKPEDLSKCKVVAVGDFVINSMNYAIGSYGVSPYDGICSPVYVVLGRIPDMAHHGYVNLILSNKHYQTYAQSFGTGILDHRRAIGWDEIKKISVALPPLDEQAAIAASLESEATRIDALIAKTERSIDLLREKRSALITAAVTGKIDVRLAA